MLHTKLTCLQFEKEKKNTRNRRMFSKCNSKELSHCLKSKTKLKAKRVSAACRGYPWPRRTDGFAISNILLAVETIHSPAFTRRPFPSDQGHQKHCTFLGWSIIPSNCWYVAVATPQKLPLKHDKKQGKSMVVLLVWLIFRGVAGYSSQKISTMCSPQPNLSPKVDQATVGHDSFDVAWLVNGWWG